MGGVAATPFLGLIGQKPFIHDPALNPNIRRVADHTALSELARTGDIVISTKPGWGTDSTINGFKIMSAPVTGSEYYHATPIFARQYHEGLAINPAQFHGEDVIPKTPKGAVESLPTLAQDLEGTYGDAILMRPKVPLTDEQKRLYRQALVDNAAKKYNKTQATKNWFYEMFAPKTKGVATLMERLHRNKPCKGNVCSTMGTTAHAAATGNNIIANKHVREILPADILRAPEFEPVAAHLSQTGRLSAKALKRLNLASRAGLGLGLAGATYGLSNDPALAAAPIGAGAVTIGTRHLLKHLYEQREKARALKADPHIDPTFLKEKLEVARKKGYNVIRPLKQLIFSPGGASPKSILKRTLPLALGGGALSYLAARSLKPTDH